MNFKKVDTFSWVELTNEQKKFVTNAEKINKNVKDYPDRYRLYDVFEDGKRIANIVLRFYSKTPNQVFLWDFAVGKAYQGKGYGTQILKELGALLKAEGYTSLLTTCMFGNDKAYSFYEKCGFKLLEEIDVIENNRHIHEFDLEKTL